MPPDRWFVLLINAVSVAVFVFVAHHVESLFGSPLCDISNVVG